MQNLAMHRISAAKACFLSDGTENLPKPADLKKAFDKVSLPEILFSSDFSHLDNSYNSDILNWILSV